MQEWHRADQERASPSQEHLGLGGRAGPSLPFQGLAQSGHAIKEGAEMSRNNHEPMRWVQRTLRGGAHIQLEGGHGAGTTRKTQ